MCFPTENKFGMRLLYELKERKIFERDRKRETVSMSINYMILIISGKSSKASIDIHMYKSKWSFKKKILFLILFPTLCKVMLLLSF